MKFRTYQGETLTNVDVTLKIDGVRAHNVNGKILSRKDKPLYNITMDYDVAEIFTGSWENTVSRVRTHNGTPLEAQYIYCLDPIDPRLNLGFAFKLEPEDVERIFKEARYNGYEGLVLRTDKYWYKVKEQENFDTIVTGIIEGKGKYVGRLGAFVTAQGNVGTGLTDKQREEFFTPDSIGKTIEVETMGLTPKGKFRHPRFIRERFDK